MSERVPERVVARSGCGLRTPDSSLSYWFPPVVITTSV
jgi:hypothetical protein